ncbi:MAG: response regulator [Candidatus Sericytochromatia bacterium]|nr:response regulator [Candidatus Sericytochromatia bacterium]
MTRNPRVLLVEDNPDTVEFLARRLREEGYEVLVARNGVDAWRLANQDPLDAIVMDINLPQLDGDEVARRLRAQPETVAIPIIFVTAETAARVQDLLVPGHTLCLEKAIKSRTLLEALTQVLA